MKSKNIFIGLIFVIFLSVTAFALNSEKETKIQIPTNSQIDLEETSNLSPFKGIVKEIHDFEAVEGAKMVLVENEEEMLVNFIVDKDTYIVGDKDITLDMVVTGYYDPNVPVIMIYPAQHQALIFVMHEGEDIQ